jgi:AcrR family transcriptional regulator
VGENGSKKGPESGIERRRKKAQAKANSQYHGKREALINAAADEFMEKGYEATAVSDIAARVDTDRATFYYYFDSKEQLFEEIAGEVTETNLQAAEEILMADQPPRDRLVSVIRLVITSYFENYPHIFVYISEEMHKIRSKENPWAVRMRRQMRRIESILNEILAEGIEDGSFRGDIPPEIAARSLFGMVNWTHRWLRPDGGYSAEQIADWFTAIFLDGFVRPEALPAKPSGRRRS